MQSKESHRKSSLKYYHENKEKIQAKQKVYKETIPVSWHLYTNAKHRAKQRGILFDLEKSDIVVPKICPVFGVEMERRGRYSPSLDRISPEKGYVKGNVQVISDLANKMKNNASQEELERFANWVLNR